MRLDFERRTSRDARLFSMRFQAMRNALLCAVIASLGALVNADCFASSTLETEFQGIVGASSLPTEGSCCQNDICAIPCPAVFPKVAKGYGIAVIVIVCLFCCIGVATYYVVKDKSENFFVAGRSLPLFVIVLTLASQSIDSNALLGNADLSYKYHFYDGAVLPIGLGLSLIINGVFFAHKINEEQVLTLPDIYGRRYGILGELAASICTCVSFLCLLAGNLVGMAAILSFLFEIKMTAGVFISGSIILVYTACGGLYSVAYTDVIQSAVGMLGCLSCVFWLIKNSEKSAPPPSIGFDGYVYPDNATAALYDGVPCTNQPGSMCYNTALHCPDADNCVADNGAYPFGDKPIFDNQMSDPWALTPFPNAIFFNWATIFVLGFGNLAALDFQARCMAAKTPSTARIGCIIAGCMTFFVGIPFAYMGAITRYYFGPDSIYAEFEADSCSKILDLPTCAMWKPDSQAFLKLLVSVAPKFLGGWCLLGIVAASMSTCDGAILALGTVFSHNIVRNIPKLFGMASEWVTEKNLLILARISTVPFAFIAMIIASFYESSKPSGATGYLLIVAFDVVLAGCVVPLVAALYMKKPSPTAGFLSIIAGTSLRIILEFSLKKDGFLLLPYSKDEFLDYGASSSSLFPNFFDKAAADRWDPDTCEQKRFKDFTGVDSLVSPLFSLLVFIAVSLIESKRGQPLKIFPERLIRPRAKAFDSDGHVSSPQPDDTAHGGTKALEKELKTPV